MPALLLSLSVHEYAHAWSATRLGDLTPGRDGRLTLSPLAHIDPFGSVIFPLALLLMPGSFFFGWAKPVQFNPANFNRHLTMRSGAAVTAAAGPVSNVVLALIALVALRVLSGAGWSAPLGAGESTQVMVFRFLEGMFSLNILLAVFNLFPLPPLDGHYLLPRSMDHITEWLQQYSLILFLAVFLLPLPGLGMPVGLYVMQPVMNGLSRILQTIAFVGAS